MQAACESFPITMSNCLAVFAAASEAYARPLPHDSLSEQAGTQEGGGAYQAFLLFHPRP